MATLVGYNGLEVVSPAPSGAGGLAINKNFKKLSTHISTSDPTATDDGDQGFGVGSRWYNSNTTAEWVCTDATASAAIWIEIASSAFLSLAGGTMTGDLNAPHIRTSYLSGPPSEIPGIYDNVVMESPLNMGGNTIFAIEVAFNGDGTQYIYLDDETGYLSLYSATGVSIEGASLYLNGGTLDLGGGAIVGGSEATSSLVLQSTIGNAASGSEIQFKTGSNGSITAMRINHSGKIGVGVNPSAAALACAGLYVETAFWAGIGLECNYIVRALGGLYVGNASAFLVKDDANATAAFRNGTTAQTLRVYKTYTSATNFERANFAWNSDVLNIGTEKGSAGGAARGLALQTDGTTRFELGASGGGTFTGDLSVVSVSAAAEGRINFGNTGTHLRYQADVDGVVSNAKSLFLSNVLLSQNTSGDMLLTPFSGRGVVITGNATLNETNSAPPTPSAGGQCQVYMKGDKVVIAYNDGGTMKYRYLDLTSTDATWQYTTTAP